MAHWFARRTRDPAVKGSIRNQKIKMADGLMGSVSQSSAVRPVLPIGDLTSRWLLRFTNNTQRCRGFLQQTIGYWARLAHQPSWMSSAMGFVLLSGLITHNLTDYVL
ncbi:hypothetical protein ElyMa_005556600 [Elysia marginata]|uniref:Wax synthase domain-containing protein n=1 Tax=Elysia marginata TaxID=1093978 RepID=A0AAV4F049_9GAST|nr:hypothetical protein ElyMa_005556600 [Elysia marginata]